MSALSSDDFDLPISAGLHNFFIGMMAIMMATFVYSAVRSMRSLGELYEAYKRRTVVRIADSYDAIDTIPSITADHLRQLIRSKLSMYEKSYADQFFVLSHVVPDSVKISRQPKDPLYFDVKFKLDTRIACEVSIFFGVDRVVVNSILKSLKPVETGADKGRRRRKLKSRPSLRSLSPRTRGAAAGSSRRGVAVSPAPHRSANRRRTSSRHVRDDKASNIELQENIDVKSDDERSGSSSLRSSPRVAVGVDPASASSKAKAGRRGEDPKERRDVFAPGAFPVGYFNILPQDCIHPAPVQRIRPVSHVQDDQEEKGAVGAADRTKAPTGYSEEITVSISERDVLKCLESESVSYEHFMVIQVRPLSRYGGSSRDMEREHKSEPMGTDMFDNSIQGLNTVELSVCNCSHRWNPPAPVATPPRTLHQPRPRSASSKSRKAKSPKPPSSRTSRSRNRRRRGSSRSSSRASHAARSNSRASRVKQSRTSAAAAGTGSADAGTSAAAAGGSVAAAGTPSAATAASAVAAAADTSSAATSALSTRTSPDSSAASDPARTHEEEKSAVSEEKLPEESKARESTSVVLPGALSSPTARASNEGGGEETSAADAAADGQSENRDSSSNVEPSGNASDGSAEGTDEKKESETSLSRRSEEKVNAEEPSAADICVPTSGEPAESPVHGKSALTSAVELAESNVSDSEDTPLMRGSGGDPPAPIVTLTGADRESDRKRDDVSNLEEKSAMVNDDPVFVALNKQMASVRMQSQLLVDYSGEQRVLERQDIFGMESQEDLDCTVCLTDPKTIILMPCRHFCVCYSCFKQIDKCPVCRGPVSCFMRFPLPKTSSTTKQPAVVDADNAEVGN